MFAVWEPILSSDSAEPDGSLLALLSDVRVRHFWDKEHVLATRMDTDAHDPQPRQSCCMENGFLWDLAAVYPANARWDQRMPAAILFDGTVVRTASRIDSAIASAP